MITVRLRLLEVVAYLDKLKTLLRFARVSDCKMEEGSLRADVNVSVRKNGEKEFGTRTEMKNLNSFNTVKLAIEAEIKRQTEVLESGGVILQETRRFDEEKMETFAMRSKVDAVDYKYYIEPNIPPIKIDDSLIEEIKNDACICNNNNPLILYHL